MATGGGEFHGVSNAETANHGVDAVAVAAGVDVAFQHDGHGSFAGFQEQFVKACTTRFGSGWGWLSRAADGTLLIESTPNQDSPVMEGRTPLLGCDVWEHAYYLHYQNRRPDYVAAWWHVVNWTEVGRRNAAGR